MENKTYDEDADVLNIQVGEGEYWKSIELENGIVMNLSKDGNVMSIEILGASNFFSGDARKVIETAKPVSE